MEDLVIKLKEGDDRSITLSRCSVIGKVIVDKVVNKRGIVAILMGIWAVEVVPVIYEVGENRFGIAFKTKEMKERALEEGLWSVMGYSFVITNGQKEYLQMR